MIKILQIFLFQPEVSILFIAIEGIMDLYTRDSVYSAPKNEDDYNLTLGSVYPQPLLSSTNRIGQDPSNNTSQ